MKKVLMALLTALMVLFAAAAVQAQEETLDPVLAIKISVAQQQCEEGNQNFCVLYAKFMCQAGDEENCRIYEELSSSIDMETIPEDTETLGNIPLIPETEETEEPEGQITDPENFQNENNSEPVTNPEGEPEGNTADPENSTEENNAESDTLLKEESKEQTSDPVNSQNENNSESVTNPEGEPEGQMSDPEKSADENNVESENLSEENSNVQIVVTEEPTTTPEAEPTSVPADEHVYDDVIVSIRGKQVTLPYDGQPHAANGYEITGISNPEYTTSDFIFTGAAKVELQDAGIAYMGLNEGMFINKNTKFVNVYFDIDDGYLEIDPINVEIEIIGSVESVPYDGEIHTSEGYQFKQIRPAEPKFVTEDSFVLRNQFQAYAEGSKVGIHGMGLNSSSFESIDPNFNRVIFHVTDGYVEITESEQYLKELEAESIKEELTEPIETVEATEEPTETVEPTEESTETAEPTEELTETAEPTAESTETAEPTEELTETAEPTAESTETVDPTEEPTETAEPTEEATETAEPAEEPTETVEPTEETTETAEPTEEPTETAEPTEEATETAEPTEESTETAEPTDESTETAEPTEEPTETAEPTDESTETAEPTEEPTETTEPTAESTETAEATEEPTETAEPTETSAAFEAGTIVYAEADETSEVLMTLEEDTELEIIAVDENGWTEVKLSEETTGFVLREIAEEVSDESEEETEAKAEESENDESVKLFKSGTVIYAEADETSEVLMTLEEDTELTVLTVDEAGWQLVQVTEESTGYIAPDTDSDDETKAEETEINKTSVFSAGTIIYTAADETSEVLLTLEEDTELTVITVDEAGWKQVQVDEKTIGYTLAEPLEKPEEEIDDNIDHEVYSLSVAAGTNIRAAADGMSEIIYTFEEDSFVKILENGEDWIQVETIDGLTGYIFHGDVEIEKEENSDEQTENVQKVFIFTSRRSIMTLGERINLTSVLEGFEEGAVLTYQWECDTDGDNVFEPIEGATENSYSYEATIESLTWSWRLLVSEEE